MRTESLAILGLLASLAAPATARADDKIGVCHVPEDARLAEVIFVSSAAAAGHQRHGDLVGGGTIHVSAAAAFPGRGTAAQPFRRITDAMNLARCVRRAARELTAAAQPITIDVASGEYLGAYGADVLAADPTREALPLVANVPRTSYLGHTIVGADAAGLPTGAVAGSETILRADPPLATPLAQDQMLFLVSNTTDGFAGNRTTIEGFVLRSGNTSTLKAGLAVLTLRSDDLLLRDNVVDDGFGAGLDTRDSDVEVAGNFITRVSACGICLQGPATVWVHGNRSSGNASGGLLTGPVTDMPFDQGAQPFFVPPYESPPVVHLEALIEDNDLTGNKTNPNNSFGERHFTTPGRTLAHPEASSHVVSRRNRLWNNPYGVLVDGGFPDRALPPYASHFEGDFSGDHFERAAGDGSANCRAGLFTSMTRFATSLPFNRAAQLRTNRYLDGARYDLTFPSGLTFWADNSAVDPGPTAAAGDDTEVWNVLFANGVEVPRGTYDVPLSTSTLPCIMTP